MSDEHRADLLRLIFGQMAGQAVATAVRLGLADLLGETERTGAELAEATGAEPGTLPRLLRALAALELLAEPVPGTFRLTDAGALLRTDRPDSLAALARMFSTLAAWAQLDDAVRTGEPTFDKIFGVDFFDYLSTDLELSTLFNASMRQGSRLTAHVLPTSYDFTRFGTVADVGGGDGTILAEILRTNPELRGILYDTAEGLAQADDTLAAAGVADRCATQIGDFFAAAPAGAQVYLLKSVHLRPGAGPATAGRLLPPRSHSRLNEPTLSEPTLDAAPHGAGVTECSDAVAVTSGSFRPALGAGPPSPGGGARVVDARLRDAGNPTS